MGLGSARDVTLVQARDKATAARALLAAGKCPLEERGEARHPFGAFADELVASLERGWRNAKHRAQWKMTLTEYAAPLRSKSVDTITRRTCSRS